MKQTCQGWPGNRYLIGGWCCAGWFPGSASTASTLLWRRWSSWYQLRETQRNWDAKLMRRVTTLCTLIVSIFVNVTQDILSERVWFKNDCINFSGKQIGTFRSEKVWSDWRRYSLVAYAYLPECHITAPRQLMAIVLRFHYRATRQSWHVVL